MGNWWRDIKDQLPAGAKIVPVICATDKTLLGNLPGDQHAWVLYLSVCYSQRDIRWKPKYLAWILFGLMPCPLNGAKMIGEALHNAVGTLPSQLRHLDITGPGLKWHCGDGFQR